MVTAIAAHRDPRAMRHNVGSHVQPYVPMHVWSCFQTKISSQDDA